MKILLIVLGVIVVLVLAVVAVGTLLPKRHIVSRTASFRATPEQLFALIAGPQSWRPDVLRCEAVPDSGGRESMRETIRNNETVTYELLDRKPPYSLTRRIATQNLPYSGSWTFSLRRDGDFTVVRIMEDGEVYNPVFRFMSRFVFGHTTTMDAYLHALENATGEKLEIKN
jgi:hypothetical protein